MAVTGIIILLFVLGHMLGNMTIFAGQEGINAYAAHIHNLSPILWAERLLLFMAVIIHIYFGLQLTFENWEASSTSYVKRQYQQSIFFSRTMIYSGLVLFVFLIYHLFHFTFRLTNPDFSSLIDDMGRDDVYTMLVMSFQQAFIALIYIIGMTALFFHLSHGISSFFQTMGWNNDKTINLIGRIGKVVAILLFVGFISVPITVFLGFLKI